MSDFVFEKSFLGCAVPPLYTEEAGCGFVTEDIRAADPALQPPETNSGFLPAWWYGAKRLTKITATAQGCFAAASPAVRGCDCADRRQPLWYKVQVPKAGQYEVTATLCAAQAEEEALLFLGRRRLAWRGAVKAGERVTVTGLTDVSPIVARGSTEPVEDTGVDIAVVGQGICLQSIRVAAKKCRCLYIMGDSTVTDQSADVPYAPGTSYSGWGQMLSAWLPAGLCVSNHAHSGLTTESFRSEGHYDIMRPLLHRGDICLMQFGHNDQKLPELQAEGGYTERLHRYIDELRALGAVPVLVTPLARNSWRADGSYHDLLAEHAAACCALGKATNTPVVDLHKLSMADVKAVGLEKAKQWFFPSDYTHTNDFGAHRMAGKVAAELCRLGVLPAQEPLTTAAWQPHLPLKPMQPPERCEVPMPADSKDPFAEYDEQRPDEPLRRVEALEIVIRTMHFFPINVYNDLYADVIGHETYAGTVQCAAQNEMIPPVFTRDGKLYPLRPVTLEEFLAVLMPAYAARRKLMDTARTPAEVAPFAEDAARMAVAEKLVLPDADWTAEMTRRAAAALCRKVRI